MPKYEYKCNQCGIIRVEFRDAKDRDYIKVCGEQRQQDNSTFANCTGQMERQLSIPSEPIIFETADSFRNVKHRKDQDKRVRERAKKFFKENEMDELIEKFGEKQSRRYGWIDKDGKKNKGDK